MTLAGRPMLKPTIHWETKNLSFLQTSQDLKTLGIKNNKFFLALYDRSLKNVDPFDYKSLTPDLIQRIITECIINPWYFKREIARIPVAGGKGVPYELNRGNLAASWCFHNHIDHYFVIPRQCGKTQSELSDILWAFLFGTSSTEFSFSNIRQEGAIANLTRLKDQRDLLPTYLQFKVAIIDGKEDDGINNVKKLLCPANKNTIVTKPGATSKQSAENIGRGSTQTVQLLDEVDFCNHIDVIVSAMGPAFTEAARSAKRNGAAYCRVFISTPGDIDSAAGACALKIINNTAEWSEEFYDRGAEEAKRYLAINSENGIMYIEYSYQEIGKDEEWFVETCKSVNSDPYAIRREILLKRLRGSTESPYDAKDLEEIQDKLTKPLKSVIINRYFKLDIYEELDKNIAYIVGVDVASGVGVDNSAITIINPHTCKPVAEFKSPHISTTQYRDFLRALIIQYIPRGLLCIERNNNGIALIQMLLETDIRSRLYFDMDKAPHEIDTKFRVDDAGWLEAKARREAAYGVWTGPGASGTRNIMFNILETHILEHKDRFNCKYLVDDLFQLVRNPKTLKISAGAGFHDDNVMSYLIGMYVYYYGKNLLRFGVSKASLDVMDAERGIPKELEREMELANIEETYDILSDMGYEFAHRKEYAPEDTLTKMRIAEVERLRKATMENQEENGGYGVNITTYQGFNGDGADAYVNDEFDTATDNFFDEMNSGIAYNEEDNWFHKGGW